MPCLMVYRYGPELEFSVRKIAKLRHRVVKRRNDTCLPDHVITHLTQPLEKKMSSLADRGETREQDGILSDSLLTR